MLEDGYRGKLARPSCRLSCGDQRIAIVTQARVDRRTLANALQPATMLRQIDSISGSSSQHGYRRLLFRRCSVACAMRAIREPEHSGCIERAFSRIAAIDDLSVTARILTHWGLPAHALRRSLVRAPRNRPPRVDAATGKPAREEGVHLTPRDLPLLGPQVPRPDPLA